MTTLTLPYPISSNRYWRTRVAGKLAMTYVSSEAKEYKAEVVRRAAMAGLVNPITGRVQILVQLYPNRPQDWRTRQRKLGEGWDDTVQCIDLGNCEKVLSDALNGIAWVDDKQHRRIILERMEPDEHGARVVVTITPMASVQVQQEIAA